MSIVVTQTAFTRTLPQIVELVLRKLGAAGVGDPIAPDDTAVVREAVDLRLQELHALGVLWFNVAGAATDLTLVSGTASLSLATVDDFLYPISLRLRVGTDDQDIEIISHRQYQDLPNKSDTGEPEKAFISGGIAYFWPTPNDNYTAKLTYQALADSTTATGSPDVAVSMLRSLVTLVAADLIDDFDVQEPKASRILAQAKEAQRTIRALNTERVDTSTVEVDYF
jgi:hypothetical protein